MPTTVKEAEMAPLLIMPKGLCHTDAPTYLQYCTYLVVKFVPEHVP